MLKIALGAVIAGFALPAFSQDNFPDVPDNHWAYSAVDGLKKAGILVGYPDGLFRGNRPMSRYEFAAAAFACYQKMMSMQEDLSKQIDEIKNNMPSGGNGASQADVDALKSSLNDLKSQVDGMKDWGNRIGDLEKMSKEFESELASMGVDVKKMRQDLSDLEGRVTKIEGMLPHVMISGTADFLMLAGHSTDDNYYLGPDNRLGGVGSGDYSIKKVGMTRDLSFLHELAFKFSGNNTEGPKWEATVVAGNMLSSGGFKDALGNMSTSDSGAGYSAGPSDIYVNTANVTFDSALAGQGFNAKIGRVGYQVGPYLWKRVDFTTVYRNDRWDNGDFYFDGGILAFNFGKASVNVFGGTNSSVTSNNGTPLNPMPLGAGSVVDRTLGVQLKFPVGEMGNVNLAYLWQDTDNHFDGDPLTAGTQPANRLNVFGGDIDLKFDKISVWGSYSQSTTSENTSNVLDSGNKAWDIRANYNGAENWGFGVGYREIENNFMAFGSWGRLGNVWDPVNIKGFNAKLWFQPNKGTKIWAKGEFDKPKDTTAGYALAGYDRIDSYGIGLDYQLGENWGTMLSYEDTQFKGAGLVGDDKVRWYTLGFNYGLAANTNIWITYQFSDSDFAAGSVIDPAGQGKYRGGLLGTQISVKF